MSEIAKATLQEGEAIMLKRAEAIIDREEEAAKKK
jgi:hypothetical protein